MSPFKAGTQVFSFDSNPCDYFSTGKVKAMTLSLTVLVAIEMFNSLNALSEDGSLLAMLMYNIFLIGETCDSAITYSAQACNEEDTQAPSDRSTTSSSTS